MIPDDWVRISIVLSLYKKNTGTCSRVRDGSGSSMPGGKICNKQASLSSESEGEHAVTQLDVPFRQWPYNTRAITMADVTGSLIAETFTAANMG